MYVYISGLNASYVQFKGTEYFRDDLARVFEDVNSILESFSRTVTDTAKY